MHGGVPVDHIKEPNEEGLRAGLANLDKHVRNLQGFGQSVVVVFNHFAGDTHAEMDLLREHCETVLGVPFVINAAYARGGEGIKLAEDHGMAHFPVCIAKTQYSFSADQKAYGAAEGFDFLIRDVVINAGSEMIVAIAGDIMRMPGLPKDPQANHIDVVNGEITGLS